MQATHSRIFLSLLFLTTFYSTTYPDFRRMVMLIDWGKETVATDLKQTNPLASNEGFGPVTTLLLANLQQQAAPILVTASAWKNFVERKQIFGDLLNLKPQEIQKKYKNYSYFANTETIKSLQQETKDLFYGKTVEFEASKKPFLFSLLLCYVTLFDTQQWSLSKISDALYLLVPKKMSLSPKDLGLKIGNELSDPLNPEAHKIPETLNISQELLNNLPRLFVTKAEEKDPKLWHNWLIFLMGHGSPWAPKITQVPGGIIRTTTFIGGLAADSFSKLLQFFNTKITTSFFYYITCYAGGLHLVEPYEKTQFYPPVKPGQKERLVRSADVFNYTIVAGTVSHVKTINMGPLVQLPFNRMVPLKFGQDFPTFFSTIEKYFNPGAIKPPTLLESIKKVHFFEPNQTPAVRLPGTEWFSVLDAPHHIKRLTYVAVKTHEAENRSIAIKDKGAIILALQPPRTRRISQEGPAHASIKVPVEIQKEKQNDFPAIISLVPGDVMYYFAKINAKSSGLLELLKSFLLVAELGYGRAYYIKDLLCKNDQAQDQKERILAAPGENLNLTNVVILNNIPNPLQPNGPRVHGVLFEFGGNRYQAVWQPENQNDNQVFWQKNQLPNLKQLQQPLPNYPFALDQPPNFKELAEFIKQKPSQALQKMLEELSRSLQDLSAALQLKK